MDIIRLNKIDKNFGSQIIFNNFSFSFSSNGLYLLLGPSGSGKTTLLNIIIGLEPFCGNINIFDKTFNNKVDNEYVRKNIAYIAQNSYFVDYLTIYDNLKLCKNDIQEIESLLSKFSLLSKKHSYPNELSGGEKERLSIIGALLQNKKVLLLDEPTASLDKKNRKIIFNILNDLKENILIICATHDLELKNICDEFIDFENLQSKNSNSKMVSLINYEQKKDNLTKYMFKSLTYKYREKKSTIFLIAIFTILLLLVYACYDYTGKIENGLLNHYKINFVKYYCNVDTKDYCKKIAQSYNSIDTTFDYAENIPLIGVHTRENANIDYNTFAKVLPFSNKIIPNINDKLLYGTYYKNENDIILGYNIAKKISDNPKDLIGKEYKVKLFDGEYIFNICGILKDNDNDVYLTALFDTKNYNNYEFLNSKFTEKYKYDDIKGYNEEENNIVYLISYFDNSKELYNFYLNSGQSKNVIPKKIELGFLSYSRKIQFLSYYATPAVILAFVVTILFYFQMQSILNLYNKHLLAVYNYYGYSYKNILFSNVLVNVLFITIYFLFSVISALILMVILNPIIISSRILDFALFKFDFITTLKLLVSLILMSVILSTINGFKMKRNGTLNVLKEGDDLL